MARRHRALRHRRRRPVLHLADACVADGRAARCDGRRCCCSSSRSSSCSRGDIGKGGLVQAMPRPTPRVEARIRARLRRARAGGARLVRQRDRGRRRQSRVLRARPACRQTDSDETDPAERSRAADQPRVLPAEDAGRRRPSCRRCVRELYALKPEFVRSPTGPAARRATGRLPDVRTILARGLRGGAAPVVHRPDPRVAACQIARRRYRDAGIRRLVALRGDLPSGYGGFGEFRYASDLIAFIRAETGDHFHIEVAAYPEMHPQARSPQRRSADLRRRRCRPAPDSAITQFFFNPDAYFRFVDEARALGAEVPVVPGIMPITTRDRHHPLRRRTDGTEIPRWIAPAAAGLRRRHRVDPRLRPRRGHAPVRAAASPAVRRACTSTR